MEENRGVKGRGGVGWLWESEMMRIVLYLDLGRLGNLKE